MTNKEIKKYLSEYKSLKALTNISKLRVEELELLNASGIEIKEATDVAIEYEFRLKKMNVILDTLTDDAKKVFKMVFVEEKSQKEVSTELQKAYTYVPEFIEKYIYDKVRELL